MSFLNATKFASRSPVQFICDDSPSISITTANPLANNPKVFKVGPGNVEKIVPSVDGTSKITGQDEYAPFALDIEWPQISFTDYMRLASLVPYYLTFIDYRNNGYYGRMILSGPGADKPYTADVVSCTATFFVLGPSSDGNANGVNTLPFPPTMDVDSTESAGYIKHSVTTWYFLTFHTIYGETVPQYTSITTGTSGTGYMNTVTWSWPSSNYCTYASIYAGTSAAPNGSGTPLLMAEILSNQTPAWNDLVGFAGISPAGAALYQQPPLVNNAYTGKWYGGIWVNGT